MQRSLTWTAVLTSILVAFTGNAQDAQTVTPIAESDMPFLLNYSNLDNPYGKVVLSNEKIVMQRLVVGAGEWEGVHSHPGNQLYVHIKGGLWSGRLAGKLEYTGPADEDGAIGWMDAIPFSAGHDSGNSGEAPIELIYITSKSGMPLTPEIDDAPQVYPNIPLELKFENDLMIAQQAKIEPGQWTGVHNRPGNQIYILVKGGNLSERSGDVQSSISHSREDGAAKWLDAVEAYELGNTGDTTIDFVLITFK